MADLQKYFEQFHRDIRTDFEMNAALREKKDIILDRIRRHLKDQGRPSFDELLQGSYKMRTGVIPIADLEYDIDVGLRFRVRESEYSATEVRRWVFEAVDGHTERVEAKGPCIRVTYADPAGYHVDLVVYANWVDDGAVEQIRLAHKDGWLATDPQGLLDHVKAARVRFEGTEDGLTDTDQMRRCVRYLKRWNDVAIPVERRDKPTGLAFTLQCCGQLVPRKTVALAPDDRTALAALAAAAGATVGRITAMKPTPLYEDMFGRLSDDQMAKLVARYRLLATTLDRAGSGADPVEACKLLQTVFGEDFPVPDPGDTGTKTAAPAIITSSSSA